MWTLARRIEQARSGSGSGGVALAAGLHLVAANVATMALEAGLKEERVHVDVRDKPRLLHVAVTNLAHNLEADSPCSSVNLFSNVFSMKYSWVHAPREVIYVACLLCIMWHATMRPD